MNKTELINQVAEKAYLIKKSEKALNAFIKTVTESLKAEMTYNSLVLIAFKLSQEQPEKDAIHKPARLFKLLL